MYLVFKEDACPFETSWEVAHVLDVCFFQSFINYIYMHALDSLIHVYMCHVHMSCIDIKGKLSQNGVLMPEFHFLKFIIKQYFTNKNRGI